VSKKTVTSNKPYQSKRKKKSAPWWPTYWPCPHHTHTNIGAQRAANDGYGYKVAMVLSDDDDEDGFILSLEENTIA